MKKYIITFLLLFSLKVSSQVKEYPIKCFKKELGSNHSTYFFLLKAKGIYYYHFTDHMVDNFKDVFWKKSNTIPLDTTSMEMIGNTTIREDQLSERFKKEFQK